MWFKRLQVNHENRPRDFCCVGIKEFENNCRNFYKSIIFTGGDFIDIDSLRVSFQEAIVRYQRELAFFLYYQYATENEPLKFIDDVLTVVLADIGSQWEKGNISLSQVYLSSRICEELINKVLPTFKNSDGDTPKIAIVTLEDHHVLGKRIVSSVIRSYGYNLIDYGHGIGYREVIDRISQENLEILLISALMLPSAIKVKNISDFVKDNNLKTKIIVGGAPFNFDKGLWKGVGADRMGLNASEGVKIIKEMLGEGEQ